VTRLTFNPEPLNAAANKKLREAPELIAEAAALGKHASSPPSVMGITDATFVVPQ